MAEPLVALTSEVLANLDAAAADARNRADLGDPKPLRSLIEATLRARDARILRDPGARRELLATAPALAARWSAWLEVDLAAEAEARAGLVRAAIPFGAGRVDLSQLQGELSSLDPDRRAAAWSEAERIWRGWLAGAKAWVPEGAPAEQAPPPEERRTAGGLIVPDSTMIAALAASAPIIAPEPGASAKPARGGMQADLLRLAEVVHELIPATRQSVYDWPSLFRSFGAEHRDFTARDRAAPHGRRLPGRLPTVPLRRGTARSFIGGHSGRALLLDRAAAHSWAHAALAVSAGFVRARLDRGDAAPAEVVRGLALAWAGIAWEAGWSRALADRVEGAPSWSKALVPDGAPRWWTRLVGFAARLPKCPGEEAALYMYGSWADVLRGVQAHLQLRAEHDEDWDQNPRATTERVRAALDVEPDPAMVHAWLREVTGL